MAALCVALTWAAPARAQVILSISGLDQQVRPPSASVNIIARLTQPTKSGAWFIQSGTITIDDTPYPAQVVNNTSSGSTLSYTWNSSGAGNPSEHTISASAQVQFEYEGPPSGTVYTITSKAAMAPANGPYPPNTFYGDGREADFVIADIRLKSLGFPSSIPLTQDLVTPVPSPQLTWDPGSRSLTSSNPAAYIQAKNVGLTMQVCKPDGTALGSGATLGYTLKLQATPNTTNPSTHQPDPALTLFDNTTATPVAPTAFTNPATVTATTALNGWVAKYGASISALNFYVKFTHVTPSPTWGEVNSYASSSSPVNNTLYAVLAKPTAPMATPWVGVLDDASNWAARTTDAATATSLSTTGFYYNSHYNVDV